MTATVITATALFNVFIWLMFGFTVIGISLFIGHMFTEMEV